MAGIGFEIRRILHRNTLLSVLQAYGFAGIISSGPWVLSILGLMLVGVLSVGIVTPSGLIVKFLVSVTYLTAVSLILSGGLQLMLTRHVSDSLFAERPDRVLPNLLGAMIILTLVSGALALAVAPLFDTSIAHRVLLGTGLVVLGNVWLVFVLLSSLKEYQLVLGIMAAGYGALVLLCLLLRPYGLEGLTAGFVVAQTGMLFAMLALLVRRFPSRAAPSFDCLDRRQCFYSLFFCGLLFNLGLWADKFVFWFTPETSQSIVGPLRASLIYDLPIFLAYLSIVPGMAVFLVRMETDFAEQYERFYDAVRDGGPLAEIYALKDDMVLILRRGIYEIFKVQGITLAFLILWSVPLLEWVGIDIYYTALLRIDLFAVAMQVVVLSVLNVLYYLDRRYMAVALSALLCVSNLALSWLSIQWGPVFFGYGFALAMTATALTGLLILSRQLRHLEYETFMLQH